MDRMTLTKNTALAVYVLLAFTLAALAVLWQLMPKHASLIQIRHVNGNERSFVAEGATQVAYRIADGNLKVWNRGKILYFPLASLATIEISE